MLDILHPHQEYTEVLTAPHHFQNLLLSFLDFSHSNMHVMGEVYSNLCPLLNLVVFLLEF